MEPPHPQLVSVVLSALLFTGCAAATGPAGTAPASTSTAPSPTDASAPAGAGDGHSAAGHSGGDPEAETFDLQAADAPSEAARMVCGDQPMDRLTSILDLKENPHTVRSWANSTFTCTYHLDEGDLVISVKEARDQATALTYFKAMQALAKDAKPIEGLANLGFPAYETADGSAVFQKDSFALHVDATNLPATVGPESITRNGLAYQLATTILACWIEHH